MQSGSIDEVIYNLANVKMAMSGDKRNEVIKMLTQLLQEAVEVNLAEQAVFKACSAV